MDYPVTSKIDQYVPFARKYRPISFEQLYGQNVLTKILTHTILHNRISQGYLLTGIRGVGFILILENNKIFQIGS